MSLDVVEQDDLLKNDDCVKETTFNVTVNSSGAEKHLGKKIERANRLSIVQTIDDNDELSDDYGADGKEEFVSPMRSNRMQQMAYKNIGVNVIHESPLEINEELQKKRRGRAERFGIGGTEQDFTLSDQEINNLYTSLAIDMNNELHINKYRLNVIHVHGLNDMSTYDVMQHFAAFMPETIEWIDDLKCNVVFRSDEWAAKCLISMGKPLKRIRSGPAEDGQLDDEDEVTSKLTDKSSAIKVESDQLESDEASKQFIEVDVDSTNVPAGKWHVCSKPNKKSKLLLLRFASIKDKKLPHANIRSKYYEKHGNPNYKPLTGLLSKNMRARLAAQCPSGDLRNKVLNRKIPAQADPFRQRNKIRPGIGVYDNEGNELEWDWEHDTRFYRDNEFNKQGDIPDDGVRGRGSRKRGMIIDNDDEIKCSRMAADNIAQTSNLKSRLGKSPLDTVDSWSQLSFNEDESLQVTRDIRGGTRKTQTKFTGDIIDLASSVDVQEDDDLQGEKWHLEKQRDATSIMKNANMSSKEHEPAWTPPADLKRMRVTIDNEYAPNKPKLVSNSVRERLGKRIEESQTKTSSSKSAKNKSVMKKAGKIEQKKAYKRRDSSSSSSIDSDFRMSE